MEQDEKVLLIQNIEIEESLAQIKQYMETDIYKLTKQINKKDIEIKNLKEELINVQQLADGNKQLINKLLGDLSKSHNDIDWYKKTYQKRSFLGVIREKLFRR